MSRFVPRLPDLPGPARRALSLPAGDLIITDIAPSSPAPSSQPAPWVLALPGLRGSDQGLAKVLRPLPERGYGVVCLNFPGMGISPTRPDLEYSLETLADLVIAAAQKLSAEKGRPPVLLGHSFGTIIACAAASRAASAQTFSAQTFAAQTFSGLALLSPIARSQLSAHTPLSVATGLVTALYCAAIRHLPRGLAQAYCDRYSRGWLSNILLTRRGLAGYHRVVAGSREKQILHVDPAAVAAAQWEATTRSCLEFAPEIALPTAVLAGDRDQLASPADLSALEQELDPHLRFAARLRGCGHLAHHEGAAPAAAGLLRALPLLLDTPPSRQTPSSQTPPSSNNTSQAHPEVTR